MKKIIILLVVLILLVGCLDTDKNVMTENNVLTEDKLNKLVDKVEYLEESMEEHKKEIMGLETEISRQNNIIEKYSEALENYEVLSSVKDSTQVQTNSLLVLEDLFYKFIKTSNRYEKIYCYINKYDVETKEVEVDVVEFLTHHNDQEKLSSLDIKDDSLPNGYYIYNEKQESNVLQVDDYITCVQNELRPKFVNKETFFSSMIENNALCEMIFIDGKLFQVIEKYLP